MRVLVVIITLLLSGSAAAERQQDEWSKHFPYSVPLDTEGNQKLYWKFDSISETIIFKLNAKISRDDVLLFGFSDYGEPTNADVIVTWTDMNGNHWFQDGHTDSAGTLHIDQQQDYNLQYVEDNLGGITVTFYRLFDTCDDDDYIIDEGTTHMVFSSKPGPVPTVDGINVTRMAPGLQRVQLLKSQLPDPQLPDDAWKFTMHVDAVPVPAEETTYWCAVRKLPPMANKLHIIQTESSISPAGEGIVHHLEVFHCEVAAGDVIRPYDAPCGSMADRPKGLAACRKVIGAWAMGANPLTYPEETGFPIGGSGYSRYVMLEVHYNNPKLVQGVIDSSGLTFTVTESLRQYDAGVMEIGQEYTDKIALPPGQIEWDLHGYCLEECTAVGLPDSGIKMFASQLHTHLTGRRAYTKHFRRGVELPELNRDNHYSPHYQEIRKLKRQVHVLPGDALIMTCEDRTIDRDHVTLGGFAISDEMCVNYVHYYPRVDLEVCKSSPTTRSLYGFFNFLKKYQGERTSALNGISANYKSINWTPTNVELLRTFYDSGPISMQCNQSNGQRFPGDWEGLGRPAVLFPLPPAERPCLV